MKKPAVETIVCIFLLQNCTPSPWNMRPPPMQEPTCMTLIVDSSGTSSGFISSTMTQAPLQVTQEARRTAGVEPTVSHAAGCRSKGRSAPEGPIGSRGSHEHVTSGTQDKFQPQPFCRKPPEGSWKRTMDRHTHGEYSIAEHCPCPATAPQELKRHPSAHTALQGPGAAPIPASGKPSADSQEVPGT